MAPALQPTRSLLEGACIMTNTITPAPSFMIPDDLAGATPESVIAAAMAMRPELIERQQETEDLSYYPDSTHEMFDRAGFYRLLQPRRFGGLEFDVPTFYKVIIEVSRGCPSTGWCLSLASAHSLQMAGLFPEETQRLAFGDGGDFRMSGRDVPMGTATPVEGGYIIDGQWNYCSGSPRANWIFLGAKLVRPDEKPGDENYSLRAGEQILTALPKSQWENVFDWTAPLGLRGSGSHSVRVDRQFVPHAQVVDVNMLDLSYPNDMSGGILHENPMYSGRQTGFFGGELASIVVGAAKAALDEYERLLKVKKTTFAPHVLRAEHSDYQRTFGQAMGMIAAAEAIVIRVGAQYMELCRRQQEDGIPFSLEDDVLLDAMAMQAGRLAWDAVEDLLVRTAGSAPLGNGQRMQRYFRDMATYRGHQGSSAYETMARYLACLHLDQDFERR